MNRSHEVWSREARLEQRLIDSPVTPTDPELAADWRLRNELKALGPQALPEALCERLRQTIHPKPSRIYGRVGFALAAGLAAVLILLGPLRQLEPETEPGVSPSDWEDFQLAMHVVDTTSRRAITITHRELSASLRLPEIEFDATGYAELFDSMTLPSLYQRVTSNLSNESQTDSIHSFPTGELK